MGNNPSVRQFKTDMRDLVKTARMNFRETTLAQADELIGNMQRAIEHNVSGHLKQSLRKKDVSSKDGAKVSVLVLAGGRLTTRRTSTGDVHDYALDTEFGNVKQEAHPFFYSTARLYKQQGLEQFRETLDETIDENNKVRAMRGQNWSDPIARISVGHRGAVVIRGKK
jgi:hypothetical protein